MNKIEITEQLFRQLIKFNERISEVSNYDNYKEKIYHKYGHKIIDQLNMVTFENKYYIVE